jgi:predicted alpha/beta-hydrolase family hydrolase
LAISRQQFTRRAAPVPATAVAARGVRVPFKLGGSYGRRIAALVLETPIANLARENGKNANGTPDGKPAKKKWSQLPGLNRRPTVYKSVVGFARLHPKQTLSPRE